MSSRRNLLIADRALDAPLGTIVDFFFSQAGRPYGLTRASDPGSATCDDPRPLKTRFRPRHPTRTWARRGRKNRSLPYGGSETGPGIGVSAFAGGVEIAAAGSSAETVRMVSRL